MGASIRGEGSLARLAGLRAKGLVPIRHVADHGVELTLKIWKAADAICRHRQQEFHQVCTIA
jgi:dihydropteroate synthase